MVFDGKTNRANIFLKDLSMSTEAAKITTFYVYKNATTSGFFNFNYSNDADGLAEIATNNTDITSENPIRCFNTGAELEKDFRDILEELQPMDSITIAASFPSGNTADITAALGWEDDL